MIPLSAYLAMMRREMDALEIRQPEERAFFLAAATMEIKLGEGDRAYVTSLAEKCDNPFGVKFVEGSDTEKYGRKRMPANQFDHARFIDYRIYPSLREAIRIERINKILRPSVYAGPKKRFGNRYPESGAQPMWPEWVLAIAEIHCPPSDNPRHAADVLRLWRTYLAQEAINEAHL